MKDLTSPDCRSPVPAASYIIVDGARFSATQLTGALMLRLVESTGRRQSISRRSKFFLDLLLPAVVIAGLTSVVVSIANANVDYVPKPLEQAVVAAKIVARVSITSVSETPCGNDYSAKVLKTYKGKAEPLLTFASRRSPISNRDHELRAGDELLVLLSPRAPQQEPYNNSCCSDAALPPAPKAELQCRAKLSTYTPLLNFESSFLLEKRVAKASGKSTVWLWYERIRTELPADVARKDTRPNSPGASAAGTCTGPFCIVRWNSLEPRILAWSKTSASGNEGH